MVIKQLSVFVENRPGSLVEVLAELKEHNVSLRALSVADTADFGILRVIVNEPEKVKKLLNEAGFTVKITPVLCINISDAPGGLFEQVDKLRSAEINIEYMYAFATSAVNGGARVVLKVDDLQQAEKLVAGAEPESVSGGQANFYW